MKSNEELHSSFITNCVLNGFLSYTAIMLNAITIHAIRQTSSLPKPLKTLLLSLTCSDLAVGLLIQPFYIALLVQELTIGNIPPNNAVDAFVFMANLFAFASFLGVMALSADRFLAIHLHLRYQELVTHKCAVSVVISNWVLSLFLSLSNLWISKRNTLTIASVIQVVCFLTATFINYKIFTAVRHHANLIQTLQIRQAAANGEMAAKVRCVRKASLATVHIYLVFLICNLPNICIIFSYRIISEPTTAMQGLSLYNWTLVFLNSSINPLIYCWKMRHIRHAIMNTLRGAFSSCS